MDILAAWLLTNQKAGDFEGSFTMHEQCSFALAGLCFTFCACAPIPYIQHAISIPYIRSCYCTLWYCIYWIWLYKYIFDFLKQQYESHAYIYNNTIMQPMRYYIQWAANLALIYSLWVMPVFPREKAIVFSLQLIQIFVLLWCHSMRMPNCNGTT